MEIKITELKEHKAQADIYGDEPIDKDLVQSIKEKGVLQSLIVTEDYRVLSGNRRWKAAVRAGLKTVPAEIRANLSDLDQESFIIESNLQRQKTARQLGREAIRLKEIEQVRAKERQIAAQRNEKARAVRENISLTEKPSEKQQKGKATAIVGAKLGMSNKTVEKLIEVEEKIEELERKGDVEGAKKIEKTLNKKSINAAHSQIKPKTPVESKPREPVVPKVSSVLPDELPGITQDWVKGKQWELYALVMRKLTGKSDTDVRKVLGRMAQDISPSAVVGAMAIAGNKMDYIRSEKLEPIAYVRAIATSINLNIKGNGYGKEFSGRGGKHTSEAESSASAATIIAASSGGKTRKIGERPK